MGERADTVSAQVEQLESLMAELGDAYKASNQRVKRLLGYLSDGNVRVTAVKASGIVYQTFLNWMDLSPAFAALVEEAEASALSDCVGIVKKAASPHKVTKRKTVTKDGEVITDEVQETREYDWRAAAWLLERKDPVNWKERKEIDLGSLSNEQLIALWESSSAKAGDDEARTDTDGGPAEPTGTGAQADSDASGVDRVGTPEGSAPAEGVDRV